jgi:hypothetical protein
MNPEIHPGRQQAGNQALTTPVRDSAGITAPGSVIAGSIAKDTVWHVLQASIFPAISRRESR